jgi:hypothetical protein
LTHLTDHLTASEVASYLDRDLGETARARIEEHLDSCASCRADLDASARVADSWAGAATRSNPTRRSRRIAAVGIPLGLAAAALLMMVVPRTHSTVGEADVVRAPELNEGRALIEVVQPISASEISSTGATFIWHHTNASIYSLTVVTESGDPVYRTDTQDTSVVLPRSVELTPGQNYFWRVEGSEKGIISTTHAILFRIRR